MNEFLSTLLQAVLIATIPVISTFIGKGVQAFVKHLSTKTDNELAQKYMKEAADAIEEAVSYTNQTYVDTLKKSDKFTEENQAEALDRSLKKATALLTADARRFLEEAYGDLNEYLLSRIEPEVRRQKRSEPVRIGEVPEVRESIDTTTLAATTAAASAAAAAAVVQKALPQTPTVSGSSGPQEGGAASAV